MTRQVMVDAEVLQQEADAFFGSMKVSLDPDDQTGRFDLEAVQRFSGFIVQILAQAQTRAVMSNPTAAQVLNNP